MTWPKIELNNPTAQIIVSLALLVMAFGTCHKVIAAISKFLIDQNKRKGAPMLPKTQPAPNTQRDSEPPAGLSIGEWIVFTLLCVWIVWSIVTFTTKPSLPSRLEIVIMAFNLAMLCVLCAAFYALTFLRGLRAAISQAARATDLVTRPLTSNEPMA